MHYDVKRNEFASSAIWVGIIILPTNTFGAREIPESSDSLLYPQQMHFGRGQYWSHQTVCWVGIIIPPTNAFGARAILESSDSLLVIKFGSQTSSTVFK